jgi:glutaredoxin
MDVALTKERVKVFWAPGCSSCLRTKEFLTKQGVEYESIDVHNDPDGMKQLLALGVRSVPVVSIGSNYTYCQSFGDVIEFLGLNTKLDILPPDVLVKKLETVLETVARLTSQFTPEQLQMSFRDRRRTAGATAFHVGRVAQMGIEAARQIPLEYESFDQLPPDDWSGEDLVRWALRIKAEVAAWWAAEPDRALLYSVPTYYGRPTMHVLLERTAYHAAQHTRQVALMLESHGTAPDRPLNADDLLGLPVPDEPWG